jgi:tetratricopeptide (TPR) repeat protein
MIDAITRSIFAGVSLMTSSKKAKILISLLGILLGVFAWQVQSAVAQAQKVEIPIESDYMYRKHYAIVEEIVKSNTDPLKRADALLEWVKANPKSRAIPNAAGFYAEVVVSVMKTDPQKAISMIQAFQAVAPAEKTMTPYLMSAYYQTKNWPKAAEIGEKLYSEKPSLGLANDLMGIYSQMNNQDKYLFYAEKVMAEVPMEKSFPIALQVGQIYAQKKDVAKSLQIFSRVMAVYGDKVPPGVQESAWNTTRAGAYTMMASDSYAKKDYTKAIELYEKVARFAPKGEEACQAWYYIGMARWQMKDQKGAIEPFAKSFVLGKSMSAKAKEYLEELYKAENNDSLDGLDSVISKAKFDLGIQ